MNICFFCICDVLCSPFGCCLVDSNSSLGATFGCVTGGARVVFGFLSRLILISTGFVTDEADVDVLSVLFLLRLRIFDEVSTGCDDGFNDS